MKIYVDHYRYDVDGELWFSGDAKRKGVKLLPFGGITFVDIEDENGVILSSGSAICSMLDGYNKKIGRMIATGRALKDLGYDKETRKRAASAGGSLTL